MKKVIRSLSLALVFVCLFGFGLAGASCAEEAPDPSTREFVRDYKDYYTINGGYQTVVEDPNWDIWADTHVTISMTKSSGPIKCSVTVYHKEDSASGWITAGSGVVILGGPACSFTIPENHTVRVVAKATAGNNGYATLQVSLK